MPRRRQSDSEEIPSRRRPAATPDERESQLVNLAFDLAERRFKEGTASSAEVVHFLKAGSAREKLERLKLQHENELLQAKSEALASQKRTEELYLKALDAMRNYGGQSRREEDDE